MLRITRPFTALFFLLSMLTACGGMSQTQPVGQRCQGDQDCRRFELCDQGRCREKTLPGEDNPCRTKSDCPSYLTCDALGLCSRPECYSHTDCARLYETNDLHCAELRCKRASLCLAPTP